MIDIISGVSDPYLIKPVSVDSGTSGPVTEAPTTALQGSACGAERASGRAPFTLPEDWGRKPSSAEGDHIIGFAAWRRVGFSMCIGRAFAATGRTPAG